MDTSTWLSKRLGSVLRRDDQILDTSTTTQARHWLTSLHWVARVDEDADELVAVGRRFHAARLAARHYEVSSLIRAWGTVPDPTYRATEKGRRAPSPELLRLAMTTFGVSHDFLTSAEVVGGLDAEAAGIAGLLERFERKNLDHRGDDVALRLRNARMAAGHKSAKAAAEHFGWKVHRYSQHESRRRSITFDQAIRYATTFGVPADQLIFGRPTVSQSQAMRVPAETAWNWLQPPARTDHIQWPALVHTGNGSFLRLSTPIVFPLEFSSRTLQRELAYCIVDASVGKAFIVAPAGVTNPSMRLVDGRLVAENLSASSVPKDPLELQPGTRYAVLGSLVATLSVVLEAGDRLD